MFPQVLQLLYTVSSKMDTQDTHQKLLMFFHLMLLVNLQTLLNLGSFIVWLKRCVRYIGAELLLYVWSGSYVYLYVAFQITYHIVVFQKVYPIVAFKMYYVVAFQMVYHIVAYLMYYIVVFQVVFLLEPFQMYHIVAYQM